MPKKFVNLINIALDECLSEDPGVMLFGLGVSDMSSFFGSTINLQSKYGLERVFEIPLSENAATGMALGLAIRGFRPVVMHQRADFAFTSAEQIINQVAKTAYMSGDVLKVPLVIRMVIGRGWGQGPTHAQAPHSIFSQIPGLQIVAPATPEDGYHLMKQSIKNDNPVIFIEHRWLHQTTEISSAHSRELGITEAKIMKPGKHLTFVSLSYGVLEALKIANVLSDLGIDIEVVNLRSIQPWDQNLVIESAKKTGKVVILDIGHLEFGLSGEISSTLYSSLFNQLSHPILRFGLPMEPTPSSPALANEHYPSIEKMFKEIKFHFELTFDWQEACSILQKKFPYASRYKDQPDIGSVGPF